MATYVRLPRDGFDVLNSMASLFGHEEIWGRIGKLSLGQREVFERVIKGDYYESASQDCWVFKEGVTIDRMGNITVPDQAPAAYKEVKGFGAF